MTESPHVDAAWWLQGVCGWAVFGRRACLVVVQGDETGLAVGDEELEQPFFGGAPDVRMVA